MQDEIKKEEELQFIEIHDDIDINGIRIESGQVLPVMVTKGSDFKGGREVNKAQIISGMFYELKRNRNAEKSEFYKKIILADKDILNRLRGASHVKAQSILSEDAKLNIDILTSILVLSELEESYINLVRGIINAIHIEEEDEGREDILEQYENLLLKILHEGLEKYPTSYSLLFHLSDYYKNAENYEFAYKYLDELKKNHTGKEIDKLEAEIKKFEKHENDILYIYDLINMERVDEALEKCEEFLKDEPKNWYCLMLKGWALRLKGKWQESFDTSLKSIENGGADFAENYNEMALCKFALGDKEQAEYYAEIAFDMEESSVEYATNLAMINIERGEYDKAYNNLFSAYLLDENDEILKTLINQFENKSGEKFVTPEEFNKNFKSKEKEHNHKEHEHCECGCKDGKHSHNRHKDGLSSRHNSNHKCRHDN